jgi:hypothetical protein
MVGLDDIEELCSTKGGKSECCDSLSNMVIVVIFWFDCRTMVRLDDIDDGKRECCNAIGSVA